MVVLRRQRQRPGRGAQQKGVDVAAGRGLGDERWPADGLVERVGLVGQHPLRDGPIAPAAGGEDIRPGAVLQQSLDHLPVLNPILDRRAVVVDIPGFEVGAGGDQKVHDLGGLGLVQRPLAIAALHVDLVGMRREDVPQSLGPAHPGGDVGIDRRAA